MDCKGCSAVFQARVGARAGLGGGGAARARQTHGDRGLAGDGAQPRAALSEVSSGAQSGAVVESRNSARALGTVGAHLRRRGTGRNWGGRYVGAAAGDKDQSQRHLSRSGTLLAFAYGKGQWAALALRDAAARDPVGGAGLGLAVSDCLVSLRAVSPAAGPTPQTLTRMGRAGDGAVSGLAARGGGGRGGRWPLGGDRIAGRGQCASPSELDPRLRLDAALYDPAPPRTPRQNGRPRKKGARR